MNFAPEKIDVIWGAVDERFKEIPVADETEKEIREKFGITDSFIICTGGCRRQKEFRWTDPCLWSNANGVKGTVSVSHCL